VPITTAAATAQPVLAEESGKRLKFGKGDDFQIELRRRVEEFFTNTGRPQRDNPKMYVKTAIIMTVFAVSYGLLVFYAATWWQTLLFSIILGLSMAEIGFNVQHDGGHQAYSNHAWINKLMAMTLDLLGGSSYIWYWKHGAFHHTYPNIAGYDTDIDLGFFGRLSPLQKRYSFHRWQHFYLWPLYGFMAIKWQLVEDFQAVITGRIGERRVPRPKGWEMVLFIGGKAVFLSFAIVIPLLFHPFWMVALFYVIVSFVLGIALSVVFQVVHVVEEAEFPLPRTDTGHIEKAWAIHQVETAVDYARKSRIVAWLVGGLNFQIEHHLFPRICHVNYPLISNLVEMICKEHGVRYVEHKSFADGVASHFRWLRRMGLEAKTL